MDLLAGLAVDLARTSLYHSARGRRPELRYNRAPTMPNDERADLLLLNASNLPKTPIFPYAFVQVSAVARRFGLKTTSFDFLGAPKSSWRSLLEDLLKRHRPRMVGLHVRQTDSVVPSDYLPPPEGNPESYYLPVEETRHLVRLLRSLTDVPVVAGGSGFAAHPLRMAKALAVDFGVQGEPDGLFEHFDDVLAGRSLGKVPNLVHRVSRAYRANPRVFYPPSPSGEYDEALVAEMIRFYGDRTLLSGLMPHAPVEIARGCPFDCYCCNEPAVKGREVRYRDWKAVEADLALLERHGIRRVWLVCSEINLHPTRARELASHMAAINKGRRPDRRIRWRSYNLPRMAAEDLRAMLDAGFEPGWNDFPSLDDENLARCRVPFRTDTALAYYRTFLGWADTQPSPPDSRQTFCLFLGNAFADAKTISTTLRNVERHGLHARHKSAEVGAATRVFEMDGKLTCGHRKSLVSIGRKGEKRLDIVSPTFYYSPDLVAHLGSEKDVREFLQYVATTFLSTAYRRNRRWASFLGLSISPSGLARLMRRAKMRAVKALPIETDDPACASEIRAALRRIWACANEAAVRPMFFPEDQQNILGHVAEAVLRQLLRPRARRFRRVLRYLGIPHDRNGFHALSPYALSEILYRHSDSNSELIDDVCRRFSIRPDSIDLLALHFLLFESNVRIRPEYRELLFGSARASHSADRTKPR
jgi:hypothetical protein